MFNVGTETLIRKRNHGQEQVDQGVDLSTALEQLSAFLDQHGLTLSQPDKPDCSFAFLTCGDWDLKTCLPNQPLDHKSAGGRVQRSPGFAQWVNVKRAFDKLYKSRGWKARGMVTMLSDLGLELQGKHHSGIDDCRNIARVVQAMLNDGWIPTVTSRRR